MKQALKEALIDWTCDHIRDEIKRYGIFDPLEEMDSPENLVVSKSDPPEDSLEAKIIGTRDHLNKTVSDLCDAFCRFLTNQVDNADRLGSTIEAQTLDRVGEKFTSLFYSWMKEEQDESEEEEPEQSSTESTK